MGSKSNDKCPYKRNGGDTKRRRRSDDRGRDRSDVPASQEHQGLPAAKRKRGERHKETLPQILQKEQTQLTP